METTILNKRSKGHDHKEIKTMGSIEEFDDEFTKEDLKRELDICIAQDGHDIYLKADSAMKVKAWLQMDQIPDISEKGE